jgi:formylmethanofuran dehydrogenase subunit E
MNRIRSYTFEEYRRLAESFHGAEIPGVMVGGFMVDLAYQHLPQNTLIDVICETSKCLPDAVQLLTPCSIGNRWLKIIDVGRFAVTCYAKDSGEGVRVSLDLEKLEPWPEIKKWFLKLVPKKMQDSQLLLKEIRQAGTRLYSIEAIKVTTESVKTDHSESISICPSCNEAYRSTDGATCPACKGGSLPYSPGIRLAPVHR